MRRKIIQIAESTQLVSLPRKWCKKYNLKKGEELEVDEQGNKLMISTEKGVNLERVEIDINGLGLMTQRCVYALYKKGVDELKIIFEKPGDLYDIQTTIGKETVGFEITDQTKNSCVIRHVSGELIDFDPVLRRTFLQLVSMSNQAYEAIKEGNFDGLRNVAFLEESNNRFTTSCRRAINKKGYKEVRKTGPIYYIIEELENLADQYKYLCNYFFRFKDNKIKINKEVIGVFKKVDSMLKDFYDVFYKFDKKKLVEIGDKRKAIVEETQKLFEKNISPYDNMLIHYLMVIMQKIFCLVGPYLIIAL